VDTNHESPRHKSQHRDLSPQHIEMVCVRAFHDLCPQLSPEEVSVKVGVMELGLTKHYKVRNDRIYWDLNYIIMCAI